MAKIDIKNHLKLYLVISRAACGKRDIFEVLHSAIRGGVTLVQLREKHIDAREYVALAKKVKSFLDKYNIPLIVNDRVDVALVSGAHGVHVGQEDIHPTDVRRIAGNDFIIGLSVNTPEHAYEANELDIDYVGIGPVFPTTTKKDPKPTLFIDGLKQILNIVKKPAVGIGGITEDNCYDVVFAGAEGVAVVSAICSSKDPYITAFNMKQKIDKAIYKSRLKNSYKER